MSHRSSADSLKRRSSLRLARFAASNPILVRSRIMAHCPKCGTAATFREMVTINQTGEVLRTLRFPLCATHHEILGDKEDEIPGHHATHWNRIFKEWFPPEVQKRLLDKLSVNERQKFISMRKGKRRPDWTFLEECLKRTTD